MAVLDIHYCHPRYVYFEKVRIFEGKKKTSKRQRNEEEYRSGMTREDRKWGWFPTRR
jgi:hypothetical protein